MLLEKPIDSQDIISIKISNGDEIIAKLVEKQADHVVVSKPLLMVLGQDPRTGAPGVQMAPFWMLGTDPDARYPISKQHVVCLVKAGSSAKDRYLEATTGIVMPSSVGGGKIIS